MNKLNSFFKEFHKGQALFGETISTVVNSLLLSLVYFLGIGLTSIFAKFANRRFLDKETDLLKESYWEEFHFMKIEEGEHFRQY